MAEQPVDIRSLTHPELERFVQEDLAENRFRADQIFRWLHGRGASTWEEMTDLSKDLRTRLGHRATIETLKIADWISGEDGTTKLAFRTHDGHIVESVLMPEGDKVSLCVSTQAGCALGCRFCATAQLGLKRNLTAGEIADQVGQAGAMAESSGMRLSHQVYMGMGEPLANYEPVRDSLMILMHPLGRNFSSRRITVSTVGQVPGLVRLADEPFQVNLAVSLNATTDAVRSQLMPIARRWPIEVLLKTLRGFPLERRRRITVEYVLIQELNDSVEDARRLVRLLKDLPSKVNLIRLNPFPGCGFRPSTMDRVERFQQVLRDHHITAMLRKSRGAEIQAGCGQLAGKARTRQP